MPKLSGRDIVIGLLVVVLIITIVVSISAYYNQRDRLLMIIDKLSKDLDESDKQIAKLIVEKNALIAEKAKKDSTSVQFPGSGLVQTDKDKKIRELEDKIQRLTNDIKNINNMTNEYKLLITAIKDFMLSLNVNEAGNLIGKIGGGSPAQQQHIIDAFNLILEKREKALKDIIDNKDKRIIRFLDLRIQQHEIDILQKLITEYGSITNLNNHLIKLQNKKGSIIERLKIIRERFEVTLANINQAQALLDANKKIELKEIEVKKAKDIVTTLEAELKDLISERDQLIKELSITNEAINDLQRKIDEYNKNKPIVEQETGDCGQFYVIPNLPQKNIYRIKIVSMATTLVEESDIDMERMKVTKYGNEYNLEGAIISNFMMTQHKIIKNPISESELLPASKCTKPDADSVLQLGDKTYAIKSELLFEFKNKLYLFNGVTSYEINKGSIQFIYKDFILKQTFTTIDNKVKYMSPIEINLRYITLKTHDGRCLEVSGASKEVGSRVQIWDCGDIVNDEHKHWTIINKRLKPKHVNLYLKADNTEAKLVKYDDATVFSSIDAVDVGAYEFNINNNKLSYEVATDTDLITGETIYNTNNGSNVKLADSDTSKHKWKHGPIVESENDYSSLLNDINFVKGYNRKTIENETDENNDLIQGRTPEDCRIAAKNKSYHAWGWRTYEHPDENLRGTCYFYREENLGPYQGDPKDNIHITGCLKPGLLVSEGCKEPPIQTLPIETTGPISTEQTPTEQPPTEPIPINPIPTQIISDTELTNFINILNRQLNETPTADPNHLLDYIRVSHSLINTYMTANKIDKNKLSTQNINDLFQSHMAQLNTLQNMYTQVKNRIPISYLKNTILLGYDVSGHRLGQFNDGLYFNKNFKGSIIKEMEGVCDNNKYCSSMTYGTFNKLGLPVHIDTETNEDTILHDGNIESTDISCPSNMIIKEILKAEVTAHNVDEYKSLNNGEDPPIIKIDELNKAIGQNSFKIPDFVKKDYMFNVHKQYNVGYTCGINNDLHLNSIDSKAATIAASKSNISRNADYNVYVSKPEYINWSNEHGYDSNFNTVDLSLVNTNGMIFTRDYEIKLDNDEIDVETMDECILRKGANALGSYAYPDSKSKKYKCGSVLTKDLYRRHHQDLNHPPKIIYIKPGVVPQIGY